MGASMGGYRVMAPGHPVRRVSGRRRTGRTRTPGQEQGVQVQRRAVWTPAITWSACWPHPAQVVLEQEEHVVV